ncbi:preprotein translocase, SecE subunit-like protein [Leptospira borgpetersenii str. Noumea 25]|nr:preprotein translocase, SecE subunit-like protein [Leptospira borgpetersenii str. Noumea 25]
MEKVQWPTREEVVYSTVVVLVTVFFFPFSCFLRIRHL